jgi:hypothetical protein
MLQAMLLVYRLVNSIRENVEMQELGTGRGGIHSLGWNCGVTHWLAG